VCAKWEFWEFCGTRREVRDFSDKMASIIIISKKILPKYFGTKSTNQSTKQTTNQQTIHPTNRTIGQSTNKISVPYNTIFSLCQVMKLTIITTDVFWYSSFFSVPFLLAVTLIYFIHTNNKDAVKEDLLIAIPLRTHGDIYRDINASIRTDPKLTPILRSCSLSVVRQQTFTL